VASDTGVDLSIAELFTRTASITQGGPPFNQPTKAVEAADGDIYVTDGYANARVHRFRHDGTLVASWGHPGPLAGQFRVPHALTVTSDGAVIVCDRENERIQVFGPEGELRATWSDIQRPASVTNGPDGGHLVAELGWGVGMGSWTRGRILEPADARITRLDASGAVVGRWTRFGSEDPVMFRSPHGLITDSTGNLYVCDLPEPGGSGTGLAGVPLVHKLRRTA
jgi:hypothetical protein